MKTIGWLIQQVRRISPRCREAASVINAAVDRRPPWIDRTGLFMHLLICAPCRRYQRSARFLKTTMKTMAAFSVTETPPPIPSETRERLFKALNSPNGSTPD